MWTDEDGITHFTDRQPDTDRPVTIQHAVAEPRAPLQVINEGSNTEPRWMFINRLHGPLEIELRLRDAENVRTRPALPARFVLPGQARRSLVTIEPDAADRSWRYRFESAAVPGPPGALHDADATYLPPVASGETFTIGQAFGGGFSHTTPQSYHAVDIDMPVGTPVHAARAGVVMDQARYFHGRGDDPERHGPRANYVRVLHEDGTMAVYAHLDYEGVMVRPGQAVLEGDLIGRSGDTGFATGPHLHFVIQRNTGMRLESVPFVFELRGGEYITPRTGVTIGSAE